MNKKYVPQLEPIRVMSVKLVKFPVELLALDFNIGRLHVEESIVIFLFCIFCHFAF